MEKPLYSTNNEQGFILPYVLFMSLLLSILITSSIKIYQNDAHLTENYLEQLQIETLFQMGKMKFQEETLTSNDSLPSSTLFEFSHGTVEVHTRKNSTNFYEIVYIITTKELGFRYNFYTRYYHSNPL